MCPHQGLELVCSMFLYRWTLQSCRCILSCLAACQLFELERMSLQMKIYWCSTIIVTSCKSPSYSPAALAARLQAPTSCDATWLYKADAVKLSGLSEQTSIKFYRCPPKRASIDVSLTTTGAPSLLPMDMNHQMVSYLLLPSLAM